MLPEKKLFELFKTSLNKEFTEHRTSLNIEIHSTKLLD